MRRLADSPWPVHRFAVGNFIIHSSPRPGRGSQGADWIRMENAVEVVERVRADPPSRAENPVPIYGEASSRACDVKGSTRARLQHDAFALAHPLLQQSYSRQVFHHDMMPNAIGQCIGVERSVARDERAQALLTRNKNQRSNTRRFPQRPPESPGPQGQRKQRGGGTVS